MNYNTLFAPTTRAERFIKAHSANIPTYGLIAAVLILTGIKATLDFIAEHIERRDEYAIRIKLCKVRAHRWLVRRAIAAITYKNARLADFSALSDRTAKRRRIAAANLRAFGLKITRLMDSAFCLD